jgi:hypothetical protein
VLFVAAVSDLRLRSRATEPSVRRKLNEARCAGLADRLRLDLDGLRLARAAEGMSDHRSRAVGQASSTIYGSFV